MEQSIVLAENMRLTTYMNVSVTFVLVYNYLLTLPEEIDYLWTRRGMGLGKILYILTRYSPFLSMPLQIISLVYAGLSVETCRSIFYAYTSIQLASLLLAECLFFLRTYVMWNCRRSILYTMWGLVLMGLLPVAILVMVYLPTVAFVVSSVPKISGCIIVKSSSALVSGAFIMLIVIELVISILITICAVQDRPRFGLLRTLMRGGALYCFCIILFSVVNMVTSSIPGVPISVFDTYQANFHALLASRLQLSLAGEQYLLLPSTSTRSSSIQFERRVMSRQESHSYALDRRRGG